MAGSMADSPADLITRLREALSGHVASDTIETTVSTLGQVQRMSQHTAVVGLALALAQRSPKAAVEYVRYLPEVATLVTSDELTRWAEFGLEVAGRSPHAAVKYFRQGPDLLRGLPAASRLATLTLGRRLARQDYGVALEFIRQAHEVAGRFSPGEIETWAETGLGLGRREYLLAVEYFRQTPQILTVLTPEQLHAWAELGQALATDQYLRAIEYFRLSPAALGAVPPALRAGVLALGLRLAAAEPETALAFIRTGIEGLGRLPQALQTEVFAFATRLAAVAPAAVVDLLLQAPTLLTATDRDAMNVQAFRDWAEAGLDVAGRSPERGRAYFRLESQTTKRAIERATPGLALASVSRTLALYVEGLTGQAVTIRSTDDLPDSLKIGLKASRPTSDGRTLYLPSRLAEFETPDEHFRVYKLMALHLAAQLDLGTPAVLPSLFESPAPGGPGGLEEIWRLIEAARVDSHLKREYHGLRADLDWLAAEHGRRRSALAPLAPRDPRQAVLEAVVTGVAETGTLESGEAVAISPSGPTDLMQLAVALCRKAQVTGATADDAAMLATLLAQLLDHVLGPPRPDRTPVAQILHQGAINRDLLRAADDALSARAAALTERLEAEGLRVPPETVRTVIDRAIREGRVEGLPLREAETGHGGAEGGGSGDGPGGPSDDDLMAIVRKDVVGGGGDTDTPAAGRTYRYDEWDGGAQDYRVAWCRLIEQAAEPGPGEFYDQALAAHRGMVGLLRRAFQALRPEASRRLKRQADGEEIDLDAALAAMCDLKARTSPSDRVYTRRIKRERDVAVALLIDMSGSTNSRIATSSPATAARRVIDVEKEGLVVLLEALAAVGDEHAVYGFSGHGRGRVEFYLLKEFGETRADLVRQRIGGVRPLVQNRDGAAIRHAAWKLSRREARIKLLILLSDGRPLDTDYQGDYALEDTRTALREARRLGIHPYCITVDREARDYVSRMYGEVQYTIIDDVRTLPDRLPMIYRRLTS